MLEDRRATKTKLVTMHDVARLANVSVATVSAVVNGKDGVSAKRTMQVREAMATLDYHPDLIARSLKVGRTHTIGMIVPDVTNPFHTEVMHSVEVEARLNGYSLMLCNSDEDPKYELHMLDTLFAQRVDGVLLATSDSSAAYDRLTRRRFPIVFIDRIPAGHKQNAVVTDNMGAAYDATKYLISLGHERIAIIAGHLHLSTGFDRVEGYRKAMQEAHLLIRDEYFQRGDFQLESGYRCGLELLRLAEPPTAIFSCNNKMTLGLMHALSELQVASPERVSILSFDDFEWAANFSPRLTTVAQPTHEIGKQAMQMLLRIMRPDREDSDLNEEESIVVLKGELRIRESTASPTRS
ncbi:MAG: LacI family DNA-binding transcriptional regulator [Pyrinomonadaceae bacterium]